MGLGFFHRFRNSTKRPALISIVKVKEMLDLTIIHFLILAD